MLKIIPRRLDWLNFATLSLLNSCDFSVLFSAVGFFFFNFGVVYFLHVLLEWLPRFDLISLISLIALSFLQWVFLFRGSWLTI